MINPCFTGCYLGSTSYVSEGEHSINRSTVSFILVRYFRVFRFRSDGTVVMATSAKHPQDIIKTMRLMDRSHDTGELVSPHLRALYGIALGNYTAEDDLVHVKLLRHTSASSHESGTRNRNPGTDQLQLDRHHLEMVSLSRFHRSPVNVPVFQVFQIRPWKRRIGRALSWKSFSVAVERE